MARGRIIILLLAFVAAAAIIVFRLIYLQIITAEDWRAEAEALAAREKSLPFFRGAILDRRGKTIAVDEATYALDFEYRAFRLKNPIAQATHALLAAQNINNPFSQLPTLVNVAASPASAESAIANISPAQIADAEPASERDALRGSIEKLLELDIYENKELRAKFRESVRRRDHETLQKLFPQLCARISEKIAAAAELLRKLDDRLGRERGDTLQQIENIRNDILADVEAAIAKSYESGILTNTDEISSERPRRRRKREAWLERFAEDVTYPAVELITFRLDKFPGFVPAESTARRYSQALLPWVVGTLRKQSAEEIQQLRDAEERLDELSRQIERGEDETREYQQLREFVATHEYQPGALIGGDGVERAFEKDLRGERGFIYEVIGRRGGSGDHTEIQPPVHGKNITLTIDVELQKIAEDALRGGAELTKGMTARGACAIINVHNGDVLALASLPDFTRDDLKDKTRYAELREMDNDKTNPAHPLHHRGYRPWLPPTPGSSFKIVTAVAGLERGIVTPDTLHRCDGKIGMLHCDGVHREVNLREAIEASCNCYFGWLGEQLGLAALDEAARRFGFSQKTGFDSLEVKGGFGIARADVDMLRRCGVGYQIDCTPLQVARAYAAVANGGSLLKLRTVRAVGDREIPPEIIGNIHVAPETLQLLRDSLRDVVAGPRGTARASGLAALDVAGKTGTAEVDSKNDLNHAWFAGYAPYQNPKIAFALYIEKAPIHGKDVTPLVRKILESPALAHYLQNN